MRTVLTPPAATTLAGVDPGRTYALTEPTLGSAWQAVTGTTIGDDLLEWPPDLFALTEVLLQRSEAYRFALSPPAGSSWPPTSFPDWPDAVADAARRWSGWAENRDVALPGLLARECHIPVLGPTAPPPSGVGNRIWPVGKASGRPA